MERQWFGWTGRLREVEFRRQVAEDEALAAEEVVPQAVSVRVDDRWHNVVVTTHDTAGSLPFFAAA